MLPKKLSTRTEKFKSRVINMHQLGFCSFILLTALASSIGINAEERLSWFTTDSILRKSIFVPDNLSEGKEENRVLPWVFHNDNEYKIMKLNCIMRGYNVTNNPVDYINARWSHPGFRVNQVNTAEPIQTGNENGVPYAIWTIEVNVTTADVGKKWTICEFQQGDFPLSIEFTFLVFKKYAEEGDVVSYHLGSFIDKKDINRQLENEIKRQISDYYTLLPSSVTTSEDGQQFFVKIPTPTTTYEHIYCNQFCHDGIRRLFDNLYIFVLNPIALLFL